MSSVGQSLLSYPITVALRVTSKNICGSDGRRAMRPFVQRSRNSVGQFTEYDLWWPWHQWRTEGGGLWGL